MKLKLQAIKLSQSLTLTFKNKKRGFSKTLVFTDTHLSYKEALEHLSNVVNTYLFYQSQKITEDDYNFFVELQDTSHLVKSWSNGALSISGTSVTYNGTVLTDQLADFLLEKFLRNPHATDEFEAWAKFVTALNNAQSLEIHNNLFAFLQKQDLYITSDGRIFGFKAVRENYKDIYSGTVDWTPGTTPPRMATKDVSRNSALTCAQGYHFSSWNYMKFFARHGSPILLMEADIADICSIPDDHNNEKARAVFLKPIRTLGIWGKDFDENSPAPNIKDAFEIK